MAALKKYPDELMDRGVRLVFELRRANSILKEASVYFAKELDPNRPS